MSSEQLSALYYPYPTPRSIDKLKRALLVFDHIYFIVPGDTWYSMGIERGGSLTGPFTELGSTMPLEQPVNADVFKIVRPADTVSEFRESIIQALKEDNVDQQFQFESRGQSDWFLYTEKLPKGLDEVFNTVDLRMYNFGRTVQLPFAVGESIMISHAVYGCIYKQDREHESVTPLTDEPVHQRLLRSRLDRGVCNYEIKTGTRVQNLRREGFDISLLPNPAGKLEDIIAKRKHYRSSWAKLRKLFKNLSELLLTKPPDFPLQYISIKDSIGAIYQEMDLAPQNTVSVSVRGAEISTLPPVIGGWSGSIIGMTREPNIANAAITSVDTEFSRKLLSNRSRLSTQTVTYELASA
jgi:hypothetical protein